MLIQDLHIRVINAATGELLRELTLDPTRPPTENTPDPIRGSGRPRCLATSQVPLGGTRTPNPLRSVPGIQAVCRSPYPQVRVRRVSRADGWMRPCPGSR
jgi:hypothetical protein